MLIASHRRSRFDARSWRSSRRPWPSARLVRDRTCVT